LCGIAGIIYRNAIDHSHLGSDLLALIRPLESRGPDSSGVAVYGNETASGEVKLLLRGVADWTAINQWIQQFAPVVQSTATTDGQRVVMNLSEHPLDWQPFKQALYQQFPQVHCSSAGRKLEIYKEVGAVQNLCDRYGLAGFSGSHGIAHTRMATESVVDRAHCHPFTARFDLAIVHNGQLANYYKLRFQLERAGRVFDTHNDSEAIAHYIDDQLLRGESLEVALAKLLHDVDGTYTLLVATPEKVGLLRDKYAAKPAVIYEAEDIVAIASEHHALLALPQFDAAAPIREPDAGEVNVWSVATATRELQLGVR
jgi:glucosamine 6-phosphate synthetase-like amidotransferase/phosphosugar isomerase protein